MSNRNVVDFYPKDSKSRPFLDVLKISLCSSQSVYISNLHVVPISKSINMEC